MDHPERTNNLYLGVDCGTQGTKALLIDERGTVRGRGYAGHAIIEKPSGAREQEPKWWTDAMKTAIRQAVSASGNDVTSLQGMAVSAQQHGLVVLDEHYQVIRPAKLWNDTETASENEDLVRHFGGPAQCFDRFGIVPLPGYTVSKLLWLANHEPENFARIRHILLPHDYLNFWLTGQLCAEQGDASGTGYFDPRVRQWAGEMLAAIDQGTGQLIRALPRLIEPSATVGPVLAAIAEELGIPAGCQVAAGGGDNMMGAIGTGNVRPGVVTLSLGTSATVYSFSNASSHETTGDVAPFCSSAGGWLPLVCTMNATNVVTGVVNLVGKNVSDIDDALQATSPGSDGMIFLPFLNGERTPNLPTARGSLHGVSANNFTVEKLIRAAVEGVSFGILNGLKLILGERHPERLRVIGGGSKSRAWRQLLADVTGATVEVPLEEEAGCLGAAMQAIVASKQSGGEKFTFSDAADAFVRLDDGALCRPNPAVRVAYGRAFQAYNQQLAASFPATHIRSADEFVSDHKTRNGLGEQDDRNSI